MTPVTQPAVLIGGRHDGQQFDLGNIVLHSGLELIANPDEEGPSYVCHMQSQGVHNKDDHGRIIFRVTENRVEINTDGVRLDEDPVDWMYW